ncbi:MAG: hypothetical protein GY772_31460 [bacterium]|nr:hypothetical protein [bacterium]
MESANTQASRGGAIQGNRQDLCADELNSPQSGERETSYPPCPTGGLEEPKLLLAALGLAEAKVGAKVDRVGTNFDAEAIS